MRVKVIEPTAEQVLGFCALDPVERVFLEDVARRGQGRFVALPGERGALRALCHLGTNVVPSGEGCGAFAGSAARSGARMLIGEQRAVTELWEAARRRLPPARADRPFQPVYVIDRPPAAGGSGLRPAELGDLEALVPACAASHEEELGVDPMARDPSGFRWRTRVQVEEGRSWIWVEDGAILFKAEASAWTPSAVQLQQVWVDPIARRRGHASRGLRDLVRLLLQRAPAVCLFVRAENAPAIALYESIGMRHVLDYRSVLL
ncbi:MAG: GNAT family N-acetyltransferase [Thermoleophilia bacterium]|nr:GNAT family N-acetyltransferase [Thermoleophilia bacterium]MDH5332493.1 GNAT family N-acetyltransferase [Thermoleophilia bacterium]